MTRKRRTSDYHSDEIMKFDQMHIALTEYNKSLGTIEELPLPNFSDEEMAAYSIYREILISEPDKNDYSPS